MKNRFWIGFAAAAVTFASLMAFAGPSRFASYGHSRYWKQRHGDFPGECRHTKETEQKVNSAAPAQNNLQKDSSATK